MKKTIALVVPVLNRFDLFTRMMNTISHPIHPIIIPNYENNLGVAASWNLGIKRAWDEGYDYALVTNDDIEFRQHSIDFMVKSMVHSGAVCVSANTGWLKGKERVRGADFCCFLVNTRTFFPTLGTFDENFFPAYFEDNDMRRRMLLADANAYVEPNAQIIHHVSQTQFADQDRPVVPSHRFEANKSYFIDKWGGIPHQEKHKTPYNRSDLTYKDWIKRETVPGF